MKNFIQPGDVITVTASADVASGSLQIVGTMVGIAATSAKNGEEYELKIGGVYELPKTSAQAWTVGAAIYWDGTVATTVSTDNDKIGVAVAVADNPSGAGLVRLNTSF